MEAHLAPTQPTQVNRITTLYEICGGPHNTQYCMEDPEQAFVEYASLHTDKAGGLVSSFMAISRTLNVKFEADFKQQQSEMTNKIDTILRAITDQIAGTLPSDTVKNPKRNKPAVNRDGDWNATTRRTQTNLEIGKNGSAFVQGEVSTKMEDPGLFTLPYRLGDSKPFDTLADLGSCVNIILLYLFKKLNIRLLEETGHIFGLADRTKSYPKDPETPLLVGRGFLTTANAVIDCRMAKIAVKERITRSVFGVKGVDLGEEEAPYWTMLRKGNHINHALARTE
ncbi:hypothetical protein Tco_0867286 [Tanacetum coccineum]